MKLRFSLKTLFAIVTILAIVCGWFVFKVNEARHQRRVVEQILELNATVSADVPYNFGTSTWLNDIRGRDWASNIDSVSSWTDFGDPELERLIPLLKELPKLQELDLSFSHITDEHLKELIQFQSLKRITVGTRSVTDRAIEELQTAMPHTSINRRY